MSVEKKIRQLLEGKGITEEMVQPQGAQAVAKDTSIPAATPGDVVQPRQGSSADAEYEERDEAEENQGAVAAKSTPDAIRPMNTGAGVAPNYMNVGEPASVVNMPASKGNVAMEDRDIKAELSSFLGEDFSDEFKQKASSLFEAAVVSRVNNEMVRIVEALETAKQQELQEEKEAMVDKLDSFMNYVVEQWIEKNELAIDNGLRTEIAEQFITGLKSLFEEHYIEVPEEKYEVIEELVDTVQKLEEKLDESINESVELAAELVELKKARIVEQQAKGLVETEVSKLRKLVEGMDFENEQTYSEKVAVVRENYFPKNKPATAKQHLTEDVDGQAAPMSNDVMSKYIQTLSRAVKTR